MIKQITLAKNIGFCFGVEKAVSTAEKLAGPELSTLGDIIHNDTVIKSLSDKGVKRASTAAEVTTPKCIIRSHGEAPCVYNELKSKGVEIIDTTCPFVRKIHNIVATHYKDGYQIVIAGSRTHAEVIGINGHCGDSALIVADMEEVGSIAPLLRDKVCLVAQTTYSVPEYANITHFFKNLNGKTVVVFDTICYTTYERQKEAHELSLICECMLVIGGKSSSNTHKLYTTCKNNCKNTYLTENPTDAKLIKNKLYGNVGIVAGASTPKELIWEVYNTMNDDNNKEILAPTESFEQLLEAETVVSYAKGTKVNAEIISSDSNGVKVKIGGKNDALILPENAQLEGEYNPELFKEGEAVDVIIIGPKDRDNGLIPVSKKEADLIKEADKIIDKVREGEEFSISLRAVEKGLVGRLGTYRVFVPQSHVQENFIKDLSAYNNKKLRLKVLEIDDEKKKIVASQKVVLASERKEKEDTFFNFIAPDVVVKGTVMRATPFGAFVDVGGFDCLCHITDLSWNKVGKVEDVLAIGSSHEFVVLNVDKDKKRVSLGYKQLHAHPFQDVADQFPVGSEVTGKVVRLADFGAFVEISKGVTGLVHISEASHDYVKNIHEVLKVGDEVTAKVTRIDEVDRKISLSIKAATPAPAVDYAAEEGKFDDNNAKGNKRAPKARAPKGEEGPKEWSEGSSNTPFADLLKDLQ